MTDRQLSLLYGDRGTIRDRFRAFDRANPEVYRELVKLARTLKRRGYDRYSIKGLFEVVRFNRNVQTNGDGGFKINNDFSALYARKIMRECPDLDGFFETRERRSA